MPPVTIGTDIQLQAAFLLTDERGDVLQRVDVPGQLRAITPLSAMELYEQLHAVRNRVRREAGLSELPTADEGLLVLAFLRDVQKRRAEGSETNLATLGVIFAEVVREVQMNRLEALPEPPRHFARCPACKVHPAESEFVIFRNEDELYSTCPSCGLTHATYLWDPNGQWKPRKGEAVEGPEGVPLEYLQGIGSNANGQEPAEVT